MDYPSKPRKLNHKLAPLREYRHHASSNIESSAMGSQRTLDVTVTTKAQAHPLALALGPMGAMTAGVLPGVDKPVLNQAWVVPRWWVAFALVAVIVGITPQVWAPDPVHAQAKDDGAKQEEAGDGKAEDGKDKAGKKAEGDEAAEGEEGVAEAPPEDPIVEPLSPIADTFQGTLAKLQAKAFLSPEDSQKLTDAQEDFLEVLEDFPGHPQLKRPLYEVARIYLIREQYDEAYFYLSKIQADYPDTLLGKRAKMELGRLNKKMGDDYFPPLELTPAKAATLMDGQPGEEGLADGDALPAEGDTPVEEGKDSKDGDASNDEKGKKPA